MTNHQPTDPPTDETSQVKIPATHGECANPVEAALWRALREARRERDEARRMYCMIASDFGHRTSPHEITPLPAGISQDEYIRRLRRQCDMEADHIAELKEQVRTIALERDAAREKIARIMEGLEGCCMTCEPVGVRNQQMERDIETLRAERDEARRWFCQRSEWLDGGDGTQTASEHGWDCFRDTMKQP